MATVRKGWEDKEFWGMAGSELIKGKPLKDLSPKQLQDILDGDPTNASIMIEGEASTSPAPTDNDPGAPPPTKPKKQE